MFTPNDDLDRNRTLSVTGIYFYFRYYFAINHSVVFCDIILRLRHKAFDCCMYVRVCRCNDSLK